MRIDSGVGLQAGVECDRVLRELEDLAGGEACFDVAVLVADLGGRFAEGAELVLEVVELAADRDVAVSGVGAVSAGMPTPGGRGWGGSGGRLYRGAEHHNILS